MHSNHLTKENRNHPYHSHIYYSEQNFSNLLPNDDFLESSAKNEIEMKKAQQLILNKNTSQSFYKTLQKERIAIQIKSNQLQGDNMIIDCKKAKEIIDNKSFENIIRTKRCLSRTNKWNIYYDLPEKSIYQIADERILKKDEKAVISILSKINKEKEREVNRLKLRAYKINSMKNTFKIKKIAKDAISPITKQKLLDSEILSKRELESISSPELMVIEPAKISKKISSKRLEILALAKQVLLFILSYIYI